MTLKVEPSYEFAGCVEFTDTDFEVDGIHYLYPQEINQEFTPRLMFEVCGNFCADEHCICRISTLYSQGATWSRIMTHVVNERRGSTFAGWLDGWEI